MPEEILSHIIGNVGVPAAICFYTLFRVNQTLKELADAINKLTADNDKRLDNIEATTRELQHKIELLNRKE